MLGKELTYTGIVGDTHSNGKTVCIESVCLDGKEMSDHCWVSKVHSLSAHEKGTRIVFKATACSYKDSSGKRKYGLSKCNTFRVRNEAYKALLDEDHTNLKRRNY